MHGPQRKQAARRDLDAAQCPHSGLPGPTDLCIRAPAHHGIALKGVGNVLHGVPGVAGLVAVCHEIQRVVQPRQALHRLHTCSRGVGNATRLGCDRPVIFNISKWESAVQSSGGNRPCVHRALRLQACHACRPATAARLARRSEMPCTAISARHGQSCLPAAVHHADLFTR